MSGLEKPLTFKIECRALCILNGGNPDYRQINVKFAEDELNNKYCVILGSSVPVL